MCRRCTDLFPDTWGRKDWGRTEVGLIQTHISAVWGLMGGRGLEALNLHHLFCEHSDGILLNKGLNVEVAFECFWTYKLR